jgi:hypothetical protein
MIGEGRSLDQFHHEGFCTVALLQTVNLGDVGMVQGGKRFRLALKAG